MGIASLFFPPSLSLCVSASKLNETTLIVQLKSKQYETKRNRIKKKTTTADHIHQCNSRHQSVVANNTHAKDRFSEM